MPYTEPLLPGGYIRASIMTRPELMRYINMLPGELMGPTIRVWYAGKPTVTDVTCDILPSSRNNGFTDIQPLNKAAHDCFDLPTFRNFQRVPNARKEIYAKHAEALTEAAELELDALLTTSTNTIGLTTNSTFLRTNIFRGIAKINQAGGGTDGMVFLTDEIGFSTLMDAGIAAVGDNITDLRNFLGVLKMGGIPVVSSQNFTFSTATGGAAGYLWHRSGVLGSIVDVEFIAPDAKNPLTGAYHLTSTMTFGFGFAEGVADPRIVKYTNP